MRHGYFTLRFRDRPFVSCTYFSFVVLYIVQIFCQFFNYSNVTIRNIFGSHNSVIRVETNPGYDTVQIENWGIVFPKGCVVIVMYL